MFKIPTVNLFMLSQPAGVETGFKEGGFDYAMCFL